MNEVETKRRQILEAAGFKQVQAAEALGISRNSLVRWLKGGAQTAPAVVRVGDRDYAIEVPIDLALKLASSKKPQKGLLRLPPKRQAAEDT